MKSRSSRKIEGSCRIK